MAQKPSAALLDAMKPQEVSEDKLETLREAVRRQRDLEVKISELSEELSELNSQLYTMKTKELPDLFQETGVDRVGIPEDPERGLPAYDAVMKPWYNASISPDNAEAAYQWLDEHGHGDLIKHSIGVDFGRGEQEEFGQARDALDELGFDYSTKLGVHASTLKAFVREQIEEHNTTPPVDLFGIQVGNVVNLKPRKK